MKKSYIFLIAILASAVGIIYWSVSNAGSFASFEEAKKSEGKEFQVAGVLNKDKEMVYDPAVNTDLFTFYMVDKEGNEQKVLYKGSKPQDFEKSEEVVIHGKMEGEVFLAHKILMKCPSKYNDTGSEFKEVSMN
ncbi:MAG: cytochrome c maturation protein CcmE [Flavobacteriales bacterium]|nr:cytochrome c maturation protein CcmE [Flavobacteriales bacterium]